MMDHEPSFFTWITNVFAITIALATLLVLTNHWGWWG
jgi:hypothetical protein